MKTSVIIIVFLFASAFLSFKYAVALATADFSPDFVEGEKNQETNKNNMMNRNHTINQGKELGNDPSGNNDVVGVSQVGSRSCRAAVDHSAAQSITAKNSEILNSKTSNSGLFDLSNPQVKSRRDVDNSGDSFANLHTNVKNNSDDISLKTSSNQTALQDKSTRNALDKYQGAFLLPIQAGKDVQMGVSDKQIEVNIKY
jgi:hypothetical protein